MSRALAMLRAAEAASWDWSGASRAAEATYDESKHDRGGAGTSTGGQFVSMGEHSGSRIADARDGPKPPGQRKPPARGNPGKPPVKPSAKKPAPGKPKPKTAAGLTEPATPRRLKLGDTGADVQRLQTLLRGLGIDAHLNADGTFSDATKAAVMEAQRKLGVKRPNGRVSISFMRKLADAVKLSPCIHEAALLDLADRVLERFDPSQPRIDAGVPGGGRWLDLTPDGPVTPGRIAEIFGDQLDEDALTDDLNFHVSLHDGHGGRVVLTQDAGDGQRRVLAHWGPNDAQALANQVREMAEAANDSDYDNDSDPADFEDDTSTAALPDGTFVQFRPEFLNQVWVRPGGGHAEADDANAVMLDTNQADDFAGRLEELAEGALDAERDRRYREADEAERARLDHEQREEERREREEAERERLADEREAERERLTDERERLTGWADDISETAGAGTSFKNEINVPGADVDRVRIETESPEGWSFGDVKHGDLPEIADTLRELEPQRAGLPEWEPDYDEDDEEIAPGVVDELVVNDRINLALDEDGNYRLTVEDGGRFYEHVLWGASAMDLASKLDAVHEQVAAGKAALAAFDAEHGAQLAEAYEPHSGAMIALVPSREDAERLADADDGAEGALPVDELHVTLAYLGKAASFGPDARADVMNRVRAAFRGLGPVEARGFNIALFNPGGEEPCIVLGMGGEGLSEAHTAAGRALKGIDYPDPHEPWCAHLTLAYTGDASRVEDYTDRVGPVVFDRVRVAFGGEVFDLPLREPSAREAVSVTRSVEMIRVAENWMDQIRDWRGQWAEMGLALRRGPEPDVRYGTGRTVTRGGSVISSRLPTRKPRANDRVRDASNPRRMGTVVQVSPKVDSRYIRPGETEVRAGQLHEPDMRVQWDDGKVETLPQERLSDPLADPPRWFDAESTPAAPKLDAPRVDPKVAREVDVENRIRQAYRRLRPERDRDGRGRWVGLADLRDEIGDDIARDEVDAALKRLAIDSPDPNDPGAVRLIPVANSKALDDRDRAAAVRMGGENHSAFSMGDPSDRPLPEPVGRPRTAAEVVSGAIASGAVVGNERRDVLDTVRRSAGMPTSSREPKSLSDLMQMVRDGDITQTDAEHYLASGDLPMSTPPRARKAASTSPAVARVAKAKAAKAPAEAPGAVPARLDAANTREDAHAALAGLKVAELREVARATGTSLVGASRAADMRTRIVEHTVGFRLNSQAIRGGSWANDPVPAAPVPTKRAPRKPKAPAIPSTERLAAISALGSREEAHAALDFVRKAELVEMARELSVPNAGSLSMQQLREWIVEGAVGRSLDSAAIRRLDAVRS